MNFSTMSFMDRKNIEQTDTNEDSFSCKGIFNKYKIFFRFISNWYTLSVILNIFSSIKTNKLNIHQKKIKNYH